MFFLLQNFSENTQQKIQLYNIHFWFDWFTILNMIDKREGKNINVVCNGI